MIKFCILLINICVNDIPFVVPFGANEFGLEWLCECEHTFLNTSYLG